MVNHIQGIKMMQYFRLRYRVLALLSMASLATLSSFGFAEGAHANGSNPNEGLPDGTVGGGSRSGTACSSQDPLLAFMPSNHLLKTAEAQTTLWFYLPSSDILTDAELVVYDEGGNTVVDTTFSVAEQSGLIGINLDSLAPDQKFDLETNYRWFFSLICSEDRAADISVDGWVQSTSLDPSFVNTLNSMPPIEQANLYLQAGLWSEAVSLLMDAQDSTISSAHDWHTIVQTLSSAPVHLNFETASQIDVSTGLY